ncbi:MAG: hypothetical protein ACRCY3_01185 [Sphingorhabdus sp.]
MKFLTKSLLSAGAAAAALVSLATPAEARDLYRDNDGISAGEVIAGALVIGGLAAILSDNDRNDRYRDYNYDRSDYHDNYRHGGYDRGYDRGYGYRYGGSRAAVNQCVNAVERWAGRYSRTDVTLIHDIDRTRYGYRVSGNLVVQDGWRGRDRYNYGYNRGYDRGRFTCYIERGRVVDIDYRGLDQWR